MLPTTLCTVVQPNARRAFIDRITNIVGATNVRVLYVPGADEGATRLDSAVSGRVWTHSAAPVGRLARQSKGVLLAYNTLEYLTTPDAADLTFGNGVTDSAFGCFAVANVTDTAATRSIVAKKTTGANPREWGFIVASSDVLDLQLTSSTDVTVEATAVITQGQLKSFASVYTAVSGGGSAANDITHYENATALAMTAFNNAGYVAMGDLTSIVTIGAFANGIVPFTGQMGVVLVAAGMTAAKVTQLDALARAYYGVN